MQVTLASLDSATAQQVFDHVVAYAKERLKVVDPLSTGVCLYRSEEGIPCFVGSIMTDEEHAVVCFQNTHSNRAKWGALVATEVVPMSHRQLLCDLQRCHDSLTAIHWLSQLRKIGENRGLDTATCY